MDKVMVNIYTLIASAETTARRFADNKLTADLYERHLRIVDWLRIARAAAVEVADGGR